MAASSSLILIPTLGQHSKRLLTCTVSRAAKRCILVLDKVLSTFGMPKEIVSDNGPPYN